jgi:hypothetical protein
VELNQTDESRNQWQEDFIMSLTISAGRPDVIGDLNEAAGAAADEQPG